MQGEEKNEQIQEPKKNLGKYVWKEISTPFVNLVKASRALWGVNLTYLLEGLTYFGVVTLLAMYFNQYVGLDDANAGRMVGVLTGGITIAMLFLGATVDKIGVRKALLASLFFMLIGRILLAGAPAWGGVEGLWSPTHIIALLGILGIIIGYGIYQPASYAAVKIFTNKKTAAMGYAMLYALMNLGGFLPSFVSPPIRLNYGITGVFWAYAGLTVLGILIVAVILSKSAVQKAKEENADEPEDLEEKTKEEPKEQPLWDRFVSYSKRLPVTDARFMFFIFILIPVQTLFAHNWLTLPQYCERAFDGVVSTYFEFFVNINPILIFFLTPTIAALTTKKNTYKMMIWGTFIMGASPFILTLGTNLYLLLAYILIMTIGESMWQPRFLQWVAEIAPKGMTGIYMGFGQFPWFLTKVLTSLYSGAFLMEYVPEGVRPSMINPELMWLIYGAVSISSPIGLILARKWMLKGFKTST